MLRTCLEAARVDGSVCVFLEPIALYHTRDLHEEGDERLARAGARGDAPLGAARVYGDGRDLTIVTWANGLRMSLRVARRLAAQGVARARARPALAGAAAGRRRRCARRDATGRVLVVDETRRTGGVSEGIVDRAGRRRASTAGSRGWRARTRSSRSATRRHSCSLSEAEIEEAALALVSSRGEAARPPELRVLRPDL